jgi:hypothetical protein
MPTTSNFGWTTPADTDLVKDGAAAIRTLGNGIDTSFLDLKGGTTGQVLSKASNTDLDFTWTAGGDITEVQAGTGISVASGTGPIPVVTNTVATAFDAAGDLVYGTGADTFTKLALGTAGQVLKVNSGATAPEWGAAAAGFVGCKLTKSVDQTIVNVTTTVISFDGEDFDTDSFHNNSTNNSRITIPSGKGGKYLFVISGNFTNAGTTGHLQTNMRKNGSAVAAGAANIYWKNVTDVVGFAVSHILEAVATDYFEFTVYSNPGNNNGNITDTTRFSCQYLGA